MAYNRKNKLTLILRIQELTLEHTSRGVTQEWLFKNVINKTYCISRGTYYNWLATNAKQEIKMIKTEPKQMQLF